MSSRRGLDLQTIIVVGSVLGGLIVGLVVYIYQADKTAQALNNSAQAQDIDNLQHGVNQVLRNQAADGEWKKSVTQQFRDINARLDELTNMVRGR